MPSSFPTLGLNNSNSIKEQVVSTTRPTSSSPWHYISPCNTRLLEDGANNSCNSNNPIKESSRGGKGSEGSNSLYP